MALEKIFLGTTTGDKTGTGAKAAGQIINNNFDYLEAKIDNASYLIAETGFSLTDQNLTMNSGWEWLIVGVNYTNPAAVVINIPFAETGKQRIDLIVMNQSNTFQRIAGTESISNPVAPPMPKDKLQATLIVVSDGAISEPLQPIVGSDYILKQESYDFIVSYYDAVIEQVDLTDHRASLNFMGTNTDVKSIALSGEFMRNGKIFTFKNHNATPLTIWHNSGTGNVKLLFPNEENFILQPNEVIQFSLNYYDTSIPSLEYIGIISSGASLPIAITDVTGLTEELESKLNSADYNQHFKGAYLTEAALISAHPTANVGDYAQVNEVGATDVVNYNWDNEESTWVKNAVTGSGATNTDELPEGTSNLYFQTSRVLATLLTGISFVTGGTIVSTDSVLVAFGKLQKQISDFNTTDNIKTLLGISTLSGSNTGDETTTTLKTKIFEELAYACSDETSNLTVGNLISFRVPFAMTLSEVRISLNDAPTVSSVVVDVKESGTSIFSTLLSIDASELTSVTAAVPAVISDVNLADDALLTVSTTQIGSGNTGKGLKIVFKGKRA